MENESYNAYASTLMRLDHDGEAQKESMACPPSMQKLSTFR